MILGSSSFGMGDILLLTPAAKHNPHCVVQLQPQASKFSRFFRDISSEIEITNNITPCPEEGYCHYALRKLKGLGLGNKCYLPFVSVNEQEINNGLSLIEKYKNPIAFVGNSSNQWKYDREPKNTKYFQNIINTLSEQYTILQFGISANYTPYKHTISILDLDIQTLIEYYASIKKYIGVDTGDTHLMLAVGGECDVHIPYYSKSRDPTLWNYESKMIKYNNFNNYD